VKLKGDDGNPLNPVTQVTTGSSGGFYFENISVGPKTLEASKPGYGSASKEVTVAQNTTISVTMELSAVKGRLTGNVLNQILLWRGISPANFRKECQLEIEPLVSTDPGGSYWISNGSYAIDLAGGSYRVVAWHGDYLPDSVTVTVQPAGITTAPDLTLRPAGYLRGDIYLDMNNDGSYEKHYTIDQSSVGADWTRNPGHALATRPLTG